jgi:hypothetical protein
MSKKVETIEINAVEKYGECLGDSVNRKNVDRAKPQGYVEIWEHGDDGQKKLVGKHNLVLYEGREWLAQRMVNIDNTSSVAIASKNQYISWLGLGDGGVIPGDPFDPMPPVLPDTKLASEIMITATDSSATDCHISDPGYTDGCYKIPFDTIQFEQDDQNDGSYLVLKITTTVKADYANGYQLSEAGLFTSISNDPTAFITNSPAGTFNIFSRVTFPSIVKTSDRRLIFNWYLYV